MLDISTKDNWASNIINDNMELINAQNENMIKYYGSPYASYTNNQEVCNIVPSKGVNSSTYTVNVSSVKSANNFDNNVVEKKNNNQLLEPRNNKMESELKVLKARIQKCEDFLDDQLDYIHHLEKQISRLDQYGRRENIEIAGIPAKVHNKNLETEVLKILREIGLKHLQHFNIVACHRLGKVDKNGCRNIIIRFMNRKDAIKCLKLRRNLYLCNELGYENLSIMENLCPAFKSIFEDTIQLKKEGHVKKVWTYNGIVNYKMTDDDNEKAKKVFHENELAKFYNDSWDE